MAPAPAAAPTPLSLQDRIGNIKRGEKLRELDAALVAITRAVIETGKKGAVTITLTMAPDKSDENVIATTVKIKSSIPERAEPVGYTFVDRQGNHFKTDPRQLDMIDNETGEVVQNIPQFNKLRSVNE